MQSLEQLAWAEKNRNAIDFTKAALFAIRGQGSYANAASLAQQSGASARIVSALKAAVPAHVLTSAEGDFGILAAGFLQSLVNVGVFDTVAASSVKLPLDQPAFRAASAVLVGAVAGEGQWQPLTSTEVLPGALTKAWASAIVVASDELISGAPAAIGLFQRELRRAALGAVDFDFLTAMVTGAPVVQPTASVLDNIETGAAAMELDDTARLVLIVSPERCRSLALADDSTGRRLHSELTINGGTIAGVRILPSSYVPQAGSPLATPAILIDAAQTATASGDLEADVTRDATLQMSTTPSAGAQNVVSLWQVNAGALRVRRRVAYAKVRSTAVVVIDNPSW